MLITRRPYLMKSDVREKEDSYILEVDLPGCRKEDIKTYVEDGYLIVAAELNKQREEEKGKLIRSERYSGQYQRSFYIGTQIDQDDITAAFKHGVLKLVIPKEGRKKQPEKMAIEIK